MKELEDKLKDNLKWIVMNADYELMDKLFSEGFEKEKEQIIDASNSAFEDKTTWGERYYNQTYNK